MSWAHDGFTRAETRVFLQEAERAAAAQTDFNYGIRSGGTLIGTIELYYKDPKNRMVRIGYWLDQDWIGQGIVTKAVSALVAIAFEKLAAHRIEIRCAPENRPSRAIPERLGFTNEGTQRDALWIRDRFASLVIYSLLRDELNSASRIENARGIG